MWIAAAAMAFAGCAFDPTGAAGDAAVGVPDADPNAPDAPDAPTDADVPEGCAFPYTPTHFDPCAPGVPPSDPGIRLSQPGLYVLDTTDGTLTAPNDSSTVLATTVIGGARVWWVSALEVDAAATLRVVGDVPAVIAATGGDIVVAGEIDASSESIAAGEYAPGAGANSPACPVTPPNPGRTCAQHGGSGGGGGAFVGNGGSGGEGGDTRDCGPGFPDGVPGGAGGVAVIPDPNELRGGCGGADGAPDNAGAGDEGVGAPGGGAIFLAARNSVQISGAVHAGGAGGGPGLDSRSGGGGGGSGGTVGVEASTVAIAASAVLAANGGGGGGGCDNGAADPGQDGQASDRPASGGARQGNGGDGGTGSASVVLTGLPGVRADRGGGGGGGGAGFIVLHTPLAPATIATGARISPAAREL